MNIISDAKKVYGKAVPELYDVYEKINFRNMIFSNRPPWARVKRSGLFSSGEREISRIGAAKVIADEFSRLTFSEKINISAPEPYYDYIMSALERNGFRKNMPEFFSVAYALGGGAVKIFADNGKPCINYIDADKFVPLEWNEKEIISGAFESRIFKNDFFYTLFDRYFPDENGGYSAEHVLFRSSRKNSIGEPCPIDELYPYLPEKVNYRTDSPMFRYFRPAVSNNSDRYAPLGISVFDGCIDTLKALDIAFDSFTREFILGKKRIIVPSSCIRTIVDIETGQPKRYFDADDEAYVALKCDDEKELKISDNTVELRVDEHVNAINALLDILCFQTGLSAGTFSFDISKGNIKTAAEIISSDSKTARTAESNKNLAAEFICEIAESIVALGISLGQLPDSDDRKISVTFPDGIIIDDNTRIANNISLVSAGLRSKISAIMDICGCDITAAKNEIAMISDENDIHDGYGDEFAAKNLSGVQTQTVLSAITHYHSGDITLGQAASVISSAMGISAEKARALAEGTI